MNLSEMNEHQLALVDRLLDLAIDEDVGTGDATTQVLFGPADHAAGRFVARQNGIMAGGEVVRRLYARLGARYADNAGAVRVDILKPDGSPYGPKESLLGVSGDTGIILMGERTALNILQRLCAVASRALQFADLTAGTRAGIYDTRKTTPGMRLLEKMAVVAGGGNNHRMGLYDMVLIKDNHIAAYGSVAKAVETARARTNLKIMIEVDTLEQLRQVLPAQPDYVLLDNMPADVLAEAVRLTDDECAAKNLARPQLEASGGINMDTVARVAQSGVDRISVGQLTNGAGSMDIGLDFD